MGPLLTGQYSLLAAGRGRLSTRNAARRSRAGAVHERRRAGRLAGHGRGRGQRSASPSRRSRCLRGSCHARRAGGGGGQGRRHQGPHGPGERRRPRSGSLSPQRIPGPCGSFPHPDQPQRVRVSATHASVNLSPYVSPVRPRQRLCEHRDRTPTTALRLCHPCVVTTSLLRHRCSHCHIPSLLHCHIPSPPSRT